MTDLLRHVTRALSSPWAITPEGFAVVCEIIDRRASGIRLTADQIDALIAESRDEFAAKHEAASRPLTASGGKAVAVIPIYGTILPKPVFSLSGGGGTSLSKFMSQFNAADSDPSVGSILLDVDSPGGSADLVPEAAAMIRNASKPVTAIANTMAGSAAYWLASQADELAVSPSGSVGSIGVFARHTDVSRALDADGVTVTLLSAGPHKVEGNPYQPLSDSARTAIQASVDEFYDMFTADVARGRGIAQADVEGAFGGGRMVLARAAVDAGMADRIATFDSVVAQMLDTSTSGFSGQRAADQISPTSLGDTADDADQVVTFAPNAERLLARPEFRKANSNGR